MPLSFSFSANKAICNAKKSNRQYLKNQHTVLSSPDSPCQTVLKFPDIHARQFWNFRLIVHPWNRALKMYLFLKEKVLTRFEVLINLVYYQPITWGPLLKQGPPTQLDRPCQLYCAFQSWPARIGQLHQDLHPQANRWWGFEVENILVFLKFK